MTSFHKPLFLAGIILAALAPLARADTPRTNPPTDYDVLARKSIFNKERVRWQGNQSDNNSYEQQQQQRNSSRRTERSPVFRAAMEGEGGFLAVLEEPATGNLVNLRKGDAMPGNAGTVEEVTLDFMTFRNANRELRKILLGQNLRGALPENDPAEAAAVAASVSDSSTQPGAASPAAAAPADASTGSPSMDEIRRRMMERRKQQAGSR